MHRSGSSTFSRFPAVLWSGILAFVLTVLVGGVWTVLLVSNLATSSAVPWSVVVMAALLWLMWEYLGGKWGPRSTSDTRRHYLRATQIPGEMFAWALVAGLLAVIALVGYWIVLFQIVKVPGNGLPDFSKYPPLTVAAVLVMASLVSSLAEEAGFRGYFQGILEQTLRSPLAIVISSLVIAPAHALTQGFFWSTMLWYFAVDMVFGGLAYLTNSILPGTVVHAIGLTIFFTLVWPNDAQRRPVWETGPDVWFWINVAQALVFTGLAAAAFSRLRSVAKRLHAAQSSGQPPALNE